MNTIKKVLTTLSIFMVGVSFFFTASVMAGSASVSTATIREATYSNPAIHQHTVTFTSLAANEDVWSATFTNEAKTMYYQVINSTTPTVQANQDGVELPKGVQIWFMGSVAAVSEASPAIYKPLKIETKLGINKVDVEGLGALFIRVITGATAPGHNIIIYCRKEETTVGK